MASLDFSEDLGYSHCTMTSEVWDPGLAVAPMSHMTLGKSLQALTFSCFVCKTEQIEFSSICLSSPSNPSPASLPPFTAC